MQHLPSGQLDEEGCFIYELLKPIAIRDIPHVSKQYELPIVLQAGDLVAVDLIVHSSVQHTGAGPYLRLTDHSGWLFEFAEGVQCMRRVPVETGLWRFYVDNYPVGVAPRTQPIDRQEFRVEIDKMIVYPPTQKLYCDKRVVHPGTKANYFRVQGTNSWVFDRRDAKVMLLDSTRVQTGLFAYKALTAMTIRRLPDLDDRYKTHRFIEEDDVVAVDYIRRWGDEQNGPFLRLVDGSGWLFEKDHGKSQMEVVDVEEGMWNLRVLHTLPLLRQPINNTERKRRSFVKVGKSQADFDSTPFTDVRLKEKQHPNDKLVCDRRIKCSNSEMYFYRKKGTDSWLFDRQNDTLLVEILSYETESEFKSTSTDALWTPDLVRGMALAVKDLNEVGCNPETRVITFRTKDGTYISVYYATGTVGTALDEPDGNLTYVFRKKCTPSELIDIMQDPRLHVERGLRTKHYKQHEGEKSGKSVTFVDTPIGKGIMVEEEEELRLDLLDCERQMNHINVRKLGVLRSIQKVDIQRAKRQQLLESQTVLRREELLEAEEKLREFTWKVEQTEMERLRGKEEKKEDSTITTTASVRVETVESFNEVDDDDSLTDVTLQESDDVDENANKFKCGECSVSFATEKECDVHCRDAHNLNCYYCGRIFKTSASLNKHRDTLGHW